LIVSNADDVFTRAFDLIFAGLAVLMLCPLLVLVSIILLLTGEGRVVYRQLRVGHRSEKFYVLKFATMVQNSPQMDGGLLTQRNDPRVLPVGRFLRKTKINELLQFFNVILGDMSIIGPRPIAPEHFAMYPKEYRHVYDSLRPGLTGLGSVIFSDEEAVMAKCGDDPIEFYEKYIMPYKAALEDWYLNNRSFRLNCKIIGLTALRILGVNIDSSKFSGIPSPPRELSLLL
jgi:lipopolysaccharide/colanic/teichoic acid biosynthesis glycosyltransferase